MREQVNAAKFWDKVLEEVVPNTTFFEIFKWDTTNHSIRISRRKWLWKKIKKYNFDSRKVLDVLRNDTEKLAALFNEGSKKYAQDLFHLITEYCKRVVDDIFFAIIKEALEEYGITEFNFTEEGVSLPREFSEDSELLAVLQDSVEKKMATTGLGEVVGVVKIFHDGFCPGQKEQKLEGQKLEQKLEQKADYGLGRLPTIGQICATKNWDAKLLAKKFNDFRNTSKAKELFEEHIKSLKNPISFPGEKSRASAANWITGKNNPVGLQRKLLEHILQCEFGVHQVLVDQHSPTKVSVSKTAEISESIATKIETLETLPAPSLTIASSCLEGNEWAELLLDALAKKTGLTIEESLIALVVKELNIPDHVMKTAQSLKNKDLALGVISESII